MKDHHVRKNLDDHVAEMAAVVNHYCPWVVNVEKLETPFESE